MTSQKYSVNGMLSSGVSAVSDAAESEDGLCWHAVWPAMVLEKPPILAVFFRLLVRVGAGCCGFMRIHVYFALSATSPSTYPGVDALAVAVGGFNSVRLSEQDFFDDETTLYRISQDLSVWRG